MNRPTRYTLLGGCLCLVVAVISSCRTPAVAQGRVDQTGTNLINQFNNCVLMASLGIRGERNTAAEMAFLACSTEEQAIRVYLGAFNLPRGNIDSVIIARKLELKKTILRDPQ